MPLRIIPSKVVSYKETDKRKNRMRELMMENQPELLEIWQLELERRFSGIELSMPKSQITLRE